MIHLVPIEPLEERYTEQWKRWIPEAFSLNLESVNEIEGEMLTTSIETGYVLDAEGSNYYKFKQLQEILKKIHEGSISDGDTLLFYDLWFPGIEAIAYSCAIRKIKVNIVGVLHAGTYDVNDFTYKTGMRFWGEHLEKAWFNIYDAVFVGSEFHKQLLIQHHKEHEDKIHVTGLPFDAEEIRNLGKQNAKRKNNLIVFPSRLDSEKQPHLFDELRMALPDYDFVRTKDVCQSKKQYYELLSEAGMAVSFSLQETFGISMLESYTLGCKCFVPNRLSYKDMWMYQYKDFDSLVGQIMMNDASYLKGSLDDYAPDVVVKKWLDIIQEL